MEVLCSWGVESIFWPKFRRLLLLLAWVFISLDIALTSATHLFVPGLLHENTACFLRAVPVGLRLGGDYDRYIIMHDLIWALASGPSDCLSLELHLV